MSLSRLEVAIFALSGEPLDAVLGVDSHWNTSMGRVLNFFEARWQREAQWLYGMSQIDPHLEAMVEKQGVIRALLEQMSPTRYAGEIADIVCSGFTYEHLRCASLGSLRRRVRTKLPVSFANVEDPRCQRLLAAEGEAAAPHHKLAMRQFFQEESELSEQRQDLISRLDSILCCTNWMSGLLSKLRAHLGKALKTLVRKDVLTQERAREIDTGLRVQVAQYRRARPGMMFLAYAHRDIGDDELECCLGLLESYQGLWFGRARAGAMVDALSTSIEDIATNLVRLLTNPRAVQ